MDLNEFVRQEAALLERTLLQKCAVVVDLEEPLSPILGDSSSLGSALMNLCVNAADAMPGGGTLTIRTRQFNPNLVELVVEDNGEGMTPELLSKAMEPFFTTKPFGKGTGLGLVMVYNTVRAMGGTFTLHSEPGVGTRAILRLPSADSDAKEPKAQPAAPTTMAFHRILFVDDDELIRASVPLLLESLGHQVETLDGGEACLARLAAGSAPDLLILDVNMPHLSGLETLQRLRAQWPTLPVLLATGHFDAVVEAVLQRDPHTQAISKPFTLLEIQERLAYPPQ
jgi:CheY-like chemotaxis protein